VHEGEAKYGNWRSIDSYYSTTESATIEDAFKDTYTFGMHHTFHEYSEYYDKDHNIVGTLVILANGNEIGAYTPATLGLDTHVGGYANPAYKGVVLVDVKCNAA